MAYELEKEITSIEDWKDWVSLADNEELIVQFSELMKQESDNTQDYFSLLDTDKQKSILFALEQEYLENFLTQLIAANTIQEVLNNIQPDDLADLFQMISDTLKSKIWEALPQNTQQIVKFLLTFDADDAAGIMTPNYVAARSTATVAQTIQLIRNNIDEVETIYYIYVVDRMGKLQGVVSLRDLMRKKDTVCLEEFMVSEYYYVHPETDQEETVQLLYEHDLIAIPVIDKFHRLLGIVTIDDAIEISKAEHKEDMLKMSAVTSDATKDKSYLHSSVFQLFQARIPWLGLLLIASTFTSNVINFFSSFIHSVAFLVLFIPVITSTGGNTAVQSSALIISGLAKNELSFKDICKIVMKELIVGLFLGLCLGILVLLIGVFVPPIISVRHGIALSVSLLSVVLFSAIIGILAPLIISKLGFDPTVIASPLIATGIDIIGLSIYFSIAKLILQI